MIERAVIGRHLSRLARAAPAAFRDDPVFRYAALGAGLALLVGVANLGHRGISVPAAPPPPATLGAAYIDRSAAAVSIAPASASIAPSQPASGLTITQDPRGQPDRFGTLQAAQPRQAQLRHGQSREDRP